MEHNKNRNSLEFTQQIAPTDHDLMKSLALNIDYVTLKALKLLNVSDIQFKFQRIILWNPISV